MRYKSFKIDNFRGITHLELSDMKRMNLLVGRNNCGKTSVLEGIFLLSGMSNPLLSVNIHVFRDLGLDSDNDFSFMFRNLDFSIPISFEGILDDCNRKLKISPSYKVITSEKKEMDKIEETKDGNIALTSTPRKVKGINLEFAWRDKLHKGNISVKDKEATTIIDKDYKEELPCSMLSPKFSMIVNSKQMETLLVQKKLDNLISVLKGIEPRISDIRMGAANMIYVDVGAELLFPVNIMGDGMRRMLTILAAVSAMKNGVLLLDEIENGFHYSSLSILWKAIYLACKEYNVQLFATTHSYECIQAFSKVYEEDKSQEDDIRLYRIDREGERHSAFAYTPQVLKAGIEKDFEVR